jgi:heat shock 70kDa protein 1/2/6/8
LQEPDEKTVLVINIGGGQIGAALLVVEDGMFDVLATAGDARWGGDYFTNQVVEYFLQECQTRELGKGALFSLWRACENIKHRLSSADVAETTLESFFANGTDFTLHLTRARFDYLCQDGFNNCATVWDQVLFDSKTDKSDVQEVVLTGGSSRLPGLRQVVSDAFSTATTKVTFDTNHPDESSTHGAAIQGAMLGGVYQFGDVLLLNAINLSLGVETEGGVMTTVVKRNTSLPAKKIQTFTTVMDQQTSIVLQVYEGEESLTQDNMLLGSLELSIPPAPRGEAVITVTFDLHAHRFFVVTVVETTSGCHGQLSFDLADGLVRKSMNNERPVIHRQRPIKPEYIEMKSIMVGHARTDPPGDHPLDKTEAPKKKRAEMKSNNNIEV